MSDNKKYSEYGLERISNDKRTYGFVDTVWTWFGSGINTGSWFFGGMAAALGMSFVLQYSLLWLPLMMIPWAAIGYIGYRYGATTVAVSRPCLGSKGGKMTGLAQFMVLIGWPSVNSYIAAISLTFVFSHAWGWPAYGEPGDTWPLVIGILLTAVVQGVITLVGHEAIRYLERISGILLLVLGSWETYIVFTQWDLGEVMSFSIDDPGHTWAFYIDLAFGFSWTWAQIADFSRFSKTSKGATVGTWLGINIGQGWFMVIGALGVIGVALQTGNFDPNNSDPSSTMAALGLGLVSFLVLIFATISTNVTVLYGAGMGVVGSLNVRNPKKALLFVALVQLALCFAPIFYSSFLGYFEAFLNVIGGLFIPLWTVILVDYLLIRRGRLNEQDLFREQGGVYSYGNGWNMVGVTSLALGLCVYFGLSYGFPGIAAVTTASLPTILVSGVAYYLLGNSRVNPVESRAALSKA